MKYTDAQLQAVLADSRYSDIGPLTSQGHPYTVRYTEKPWTKLFIKPFSIKELGLISKAAVLKDMTHMIRAIDQVITQDAAELSIGDFYYVLMWLRIHSMPKTPLVVEWKCTEKVYTHKEDASVVFNDKTFMVPKEPKQYKLVPCDTHNTESIHMSKVDILSLPDPSAGEVWHELPEGFDFPRAKHIVQIEEYLANPETNLLTAAIQWMAGNTMEEKYANLEKGGMDTLDTAMALNDTVVHGISELTTLHCRKCRKEQSYAVNLTPFTFFQ